MERPRRATWRIGIREQKRLQSVFVIIICVLLYVVVIGPWIEGVIQTRNFQTCQSNVHEIAQALSVYSEAWDDTLPPASIWMEATEGNLRATGRSVESFFKCPEDKSGAPSSYVYNDLLGGLSPIVSPKNPKDIERFQQIRNRNSAPLVIEKHNSPRNAHQLFTTWDQLVAAMTRPHHVPTPTGSYITGARAAKFIDDEKLNALTGRGF